jgi:dTDP-4-amino-4,6-dideoxygalactose transaminase
VSFLTAPDADQLRIKLAHPVLGIEELAAVERVFKSGMLTTGPETAAFEDAFAARHGTAYAVALASGTAALAAIYLGLGIGPGDEVIVPSLTFISTATAVLHVGARPVFADIDRRTFNLDPADVAARVTPRTKAIVAVHYGGQPADLDELAAIADGAGLHLLEDAAEAHGAFYKGRSAGSIGHAGMFSFTPTKNMTTGEGGMVTTDDGDLADRVRLLRSHGQTDQYVHAHLGYNWRISDILSAIGRVQLTKLDDIVARKVELAKRMNRHLAEIEGIHAPLARGDRTHVYMLYTIVVDDDRDALAASLLSEGIEARLYFPPAHRQPVFAGRDPVSLPNTDWAADHLLSIPIHHGLRDSEIDEIADAILEHR